MFLEPPVSPAPAVALVRAAARPALIGVAPRPAPSDTADARYARATFSPGHGRDGRLSIRVAARPGTTLRFLIRRVSQRQVVYRSPQVAVGESGVARLRR